jgi:GR25 family glycosyltransferase involved in LPS biosynthesis
MLVYYINLAGRTDRRAFMEGQFARLGLTATRIEAVTPDDLVGPEFAFEAKRWGRLAPRQLCCGLSHVRASKAMLADDSDVGIILEDDVLLSLRLPAFMNAFENLSPKLDLLRIETTFERMRLLPSRHAEIEGIGLFKAYSWASGAGGYLVSRNAAEQIARSREFWKRPADQVLCNPYEPLPRRLRLLQLNPGLAVQMDRWKGVPALSSDLQDERLQVSDSKTDYWRRRPQAISDWVHRDIVVAAQKAWHQYVRGARKQPVPFSST